MTDRNQLRRIKFVRPEQKLFFSTLQQRVDDYFRQSGKSKHADTQMIVKTGVLLSLYIGPFIFLLAFQPPLWAAFFLWALMGVAMAGVGMSVMHDANHGAYSANRSVNDAVAYSLNLLGGSIHNWKLQHNLLHHTYTNISGMDEDIDDKGGMRFSPHSNLKHPHRFQFIYAFFIYGLTTLYWVVGKDFVQFARHLRRGVNRADAARNRATMLRILVLKIAYFSVVLALPIAVGIPPMQVLAGFALMHFISGVILTVIFQLAHTVDGTDHPLPDLNGEIDNEWAVHQMRTTVNFAPRNRFLNWYVGGLNYQVEHHLFPSICHVHYPALAPIVKRTATEFGVPYLENPTFWTALRSHIRLLQRLGRPSLDEAIA